MPETVKRDDEPTPMRVKETASPGAMDRMEEVWVWVNSYLEEADRRFLYAWSWVKVRKGMKISAFARENDVCERTLRRRIISLCHIISEQLNIVRSPMLDSGDLRVSENEGESDQSTVTGQKRATTLHWLDMGAKPTYDPNSPELASLIQRLEDGNEERRIREERRRAKLEREAA